LGPSPLRDSPGIDNMDTLKEGEYAIRDQTTS
jgi:hypothetical protein